MVHHLGDEKPGGPAAVEDHPLMWLAHWGAVTVVSAMEDYEFRALKVQSMGETVERAGMDWHRLRSRMAACLMKGSRTSGSTLVTGRGKNF
jgi:hypothetical protein